MGDSMVNVVARISARGDHFTAHYVLARYGCHLSRREALTVAASGRAVPLDQQAAEHILAGFARPATNHETESR